MVRCLPIIVVYLPTNSYEEPIIFSKTMLKGAIFKMLNSKDKHQDNLLKRFRVIGRDLGLWARGYDLIWRCRQIFRDFDFSGKNILEIGCGNGIFVIWAAINGAQHAVGLEPFCEGSRTYEEHKTFSNFHRLKRSLDIQQIEVFPQRFQDYVCNENIYDLILSINSINHLDEKSCEDLGKSQGALETYLKLFKKLRSLLKMGGKLIVIDVSNRNFFFHHNFTNPFEKTVQWRKHQSPHIWANLLTKCGFTSPQISWNSGRLLRYFGIYGIPWSISYYYNSSFRLEMIANGQDRILYK